MILILSFILLIMLSAWCLFRGILRLSAKRIDIIMGVLGLLAVGYLMWIW